MENGGVTWCGDLSSAGARAKRKCSATLQGMTSPTAGDAATWAGVWNSSGRNERSIRYERPSSLGRSHKLLMADSIWQKKNGQ